MPDEQSPRAQIQATRPRSSWRAAAGAAVVGVAIAALITVDGDLFGHSLASVERGGLCAGVGAVFAAVAALIRRR